ncbi:tyrosine-type recombinase/integrase [Nitratireductor pacificus]|uniref:tyrosine-type recombinase/integrase n=1 Tax=Nitratireductor pacificus TaxID=1231180 RepID=UPI003B75CBC6
MLLRYWHGHVCKLDGQGRLVRIASHEQAKHGLALWNEYWGEATIADLTIDRQEAFVIWLKDRGYKNAYVSRVLSVGRAAVNRAWKRQEIKSAPFIIDEPDRSDQTERYRLTLDEMRRLLTTARKWPHLHTFCMIALNTLARPDAVLDLSPRQVDLEIRRIELNPPGRKQTKKRRPVVPITETLLPYLKARDLERFVNWHGKPIKSIKKVFATMVKEAGLPKEVTPYSLRHTMAAELRRRGVPAWEVQGLLGHKAVGVTEVYARFDPDYMATGSRAIDDYFAELGPSFRYRKADLNNSYQVCVPPALHSAEIRLSVEPRNFAVSGAWMVGVTGIEPVTPTMST